MRVSAHQIGSVSYEVDRHDTITAVGGEWVAFALANDAPELAQGVIGHSMWEFIAGTQTREVYHELLARARSHDPIAFPFRCDSPTMFRLMSMSMRLTSDQAVRFETRLEAWGERAVIPTDVHAPSLIRMCSWCGRIDVDGVWRRPEYFAGQLDTFMGANPSSITFVLCPTCGLVLERGDAPLLV
jgi:hypothetical protein